MHLLKRLPRPTLLNLLLLLSLTYLGSCAAPQKKKHKRKRTYRQETTQEFESLENQSSGPIDLYREMRQKEWENYKSRGKRSSGINVYAPPTRKKKKTQRPLRYQRPDPAAKIEQQQYSEQKSEDTPPPIAQIPLDPEKAKEIQVQVEQYTQYYCMKNRKSSRFSNQADCLAYTQDVTYQCENNHGLSTKLTRCVKRKLNMR